MEQEPRSEIDDLPARLGFIETDELISLRRQIGEAIDSSDNAKIKDLFARYQALGEEVVNKLEGDAFPKGQIGFILAKAAVWREAGRLDLATTELYDAYTYADNMGDEAVTAAIHQAYEQARAEGYSEGVAEKVVSLLKELKAEGIEVDFDEDDLGHVGQMDDEEATAYLFDCLIDAGVEDPEAILKEKGLLE